MKVNLAYSISIVIYRIPVSSIVLSLLHISRRCCDLITITEHAYCNSVS